MRFLNFQIQRVKIEKNMGYIFKHYLLFCVGVLGLFVESNGIVFGVAILGSFLFALIYYFSRKDNEKCQKCGALWSVKFIDKATLTQSAIKQKMTTYLVGDEKLIYHCNQCGNETSKVQIYKREA